ncbi:methionine--tRNA ligase, partial [Streptomyces sp. NPDC002763]
PWLEIKTDKEGAALTLRTAMNLIHLYAVVSEPFIPATAKTMREAFSLPDDTAVWVTQDEAKALTAVPAGTPFTVPPVLFAKLTDEDLATYKDRFGGESA